MLVEIWSDIVCPWCYIGKARFEKSLAVSPHRDEVEVVFRSFELDPTRARDAATPVVTMLADKYGLSEDQARQAEQDVAQNAAAEGLPYRTDRAHGNTFDIHRLIQLAKEHGRQDVMVDLAYRANFAEGTIFVPGRLEELAAEAGLDPEAVRKVLADETAYADAVRADEQEAARLGATGVPFFVFDGRLGVSGAQPVELLTRALAEAWDTAAPQ
jgi:predicted DsbA family dithiol-disulfide isomerase